MDATQTVTTRNSLLSGCHLMESSTEIESEFSSLDEQLLKQMELARTKLLEQQQEIIDLKREKVNLLKQVTDLCLALEGKENELNDFIQSYEQKTLETARYLKELNLLADELEGTSVKLARLERCLPRGGSAAQLDSATQTPIIGRAAANHNNHHTHQENPCGTPPTRSGGGGVIWGSGGNVGGGVQTPPPPQLSESLPSSAGTNISTQSNALSYDSGVAGLSSTESPGPPIRGCQSIEAADTQHRRLRWLKIDGSLDKSQQSTTKEIASGDNSAKLTNLIALSRAAVNGLCPSSQPSDERSGSSGLQLQARPDLEAAVCRLPPFCWTRDHVTLWMGHHVGMPETCVRKAAELDIDGPRLAQLAEASMEKMLGLSEYHQRRKLALALEDLRVHGPPGIPKAPAPGRLSLRWVTEEWMSRELGLSRLAQGCWERGVDGRLVGCLPPPGTGGSGRKEAGRLIGVRLAKREGASLMAGAELLRRIGFDIQVLSRRRQVSEPTEVDPLVWTNQRVAKWLVDLDLAGFTNGMNNSGLHGALMVLDPSFSAATLAKMLNIPGHLVKSTRLEDRFTALVKPARLNERVNVKRAASIFKPRRRSSSQPRGSDFLVHHNNQPSSSASSAIGLIQGNQSDFGLSGVCSSPTPIQQQLSSDVTLGTDKVDINTTLCYASLPRKLTRPTTSTPGPSGAGLRLDTAAAAASANQNHRNGGGGTLTPTPSSCESTVGGGGKSPSSWSTPPSRGDNSHPPLQPPLVGGVGVTSGGTTDTARRSSTARVLLKKRISLATAESNNNNNRAAEVRRRASGQGAILVYRK